MKAPENPPDYRKLMKEDDKLFDNLLRPEVRTFIQNCAKDYPYWTKFKYLQMPAGLTPEVAWALREASSFGARRYLPLNDTKKNPFYFWLPAGAQELLHQIDRKSPAQIFGENAPSPQARTRHIVSSLMEEAIASSQIEGAATTRKVAKEMLRTGRTPSNKFEKMIANNYKAMERLRDLKNSPLTVEILLELQTTLTEGTLDDPDAAGRFRRTPEDDNIVVEDFDGNILHHPPTGAELPARIEKLLNFANDDTSEGFIHPVVKAVLLHFWIGYDHPFVDGNGRTARAVFYWYMLRKGYWLFEYVSISRIVLKAMGDYKRAYLYSEAGECDATYFLMFNLRAIDIAMDDVHRYIERKKKEIEDSASALRSFPDINFRQRELLLDALKKPGRSYSIYEHRNTHQVSYQTARTDLQDLEAKGFLSAIRDGKTFRYEATAKLNTVVPEQPQQ